MGWTFYGRGDRSTAIKRFNQAWLLDADNQLALWGFAVISRDRGKLDDALRFYELALEQGPGQAKLQDEYKLLSDLASRKPE